MEFPKTVYVRYDHDQLAAGKTPTDIADWGEKYIVAQYQLEQVGTASIQFIPGLPVQKPKKKKATKSTK